ncbi:hypothetical protein ACGF8B_21765 [Streptomyces sp. NPDC047917]|uniref:hypothetical protein n=1 Tax=Streptomyces sp. NPDC047917 TaxID=3365491 RepID=UPI003723EE76
MRREGRKAEIAGVDHEIGRERLDESFMGAGVAQVTMECDHLVDRRPVVGRQAHRELQTHR